jgi:hypothetical protein
MDRPFRSPTGWQQAQQRTPPAPVWRGKEAAPALRDRARLLAGNLSKVQNTLRPFKRS